MPGHFLKCSVSLLVHSMQSTIRCLKQTFDHPITHSPGRPPLLFSLGLSYASKNSPPFVPPGSNPPKSVPPSSQLRANGRYGFAGQRHRTARWVDDMLRLRAGRGELSSSTEGGWNERLAEEVRRWGAGEDFFAVVDSGSMVCPPHSSLS